MNTPFNDELLSAYLDNELSDEEHARVEAWLAESAEHRRTLDELRSLRDDLRQLPRVTLDDRFRRRVLNSIRMRMDDHDAFDAPQLSVEPPSSPMIAVSAGALPPLSSAEASSAEASPEVMPAKSQVPLSRPSWQWLSAGVAATLLIGVLTISSRVQQQQEIGMRTFAPEAHPSAGFGALPRAKEVSPANAPRVDFKHDLAGEHKGEERKAVIGEVERLEKKQAEDSPANSETSSTARLQANPLIVPPPANAPAPIAKAEKSAPQAAMGGAGGAANESQLADEASHLRRAKVASDKQNAFSGKAAAEGWQVALESARNAPGVVEVQVALADPTAGPAWLAAKLAPQAQNGVATNNLAMRDAIKLKNDSIDQRKRSEMKKAAVPNDRQAADALAAGSPAPGAAAAEKSLAENSTATPQSLKDLLKDVTSTATVELTAAELGSVLETLDGGALPNKPGTRGTADLAATLLDAQFIPSPGASREARALASGVVSPAESAKPAEKEQAKSFEDAQARPTGILAKTKGEAGANAKQIEQSEATADAKPESALPASPGQAGNKQPREAGREAASPARIRVKFIFVPREIPAEPSP